MLALTVASFALGLGLDDIREREIEGPGGPVTLAEVRGVQYRKIGLQELLSPTLDGQAVCAEGKFGGSRSRKGLLTFSMLGTDREFIYSAPGLVGGVMRGDNIWIGGKAMLYRQDPLRRNTCYVHVSLLIGLPVDKDLFAQRYARYKEQKDWRKMDALAEWADKARKEAAPRDFGEFEAYKTLRRKARKSALYLRAEALDARGPTPELAREYYEVASALHSEFKARADAKSLLLKAVALDPKYDRAVRKLEELGYVSFRGQYVTQAEKLRILAEEERRAEVESATTRPERPTHEIQDIVERAGLAAELIQAVRKGPAGLDRLVEMLDTYDDASLGREIAFYLANMPDPAGLKGLITAASSPTAAVRAEAVKMLRRRGTKRALVALARVARDDGDEAIRAEALSAIAAARTGEAVGELVGLVGAKKEDVKAAALRHLKDLTGKEFETYVEWQKWWQENKLGFRPRR